MKKKILVIYYTQTGQLRDIVQNFAQPYEKKPDAYQVDYLEIKLKKDFPFPWPAEVFYNTFPESYMQVPSEIESPPQEILQNHYDLVILGYQVWFLTPSIPTVSFLKSPFAEKLLKNTPVFTVSGTRNMWMLSQEKLKVHLKRLGAELVGNVALVDRHNNYTSVITILNWMSTGIKEQKPPLPKAGIADAEIAGVSKYGIIAEKYTAKNGYDGMQKELVEHGAVEVRPFLVKVEQVGNKLFSFFANKIKNNPSRRIFWVKIYKFYLFFAIWVVSPIVLFFFTLLTPIFWWKRQKQIKYFQGI